MLFWSFSGNFTQMNAPQITNIQYPLMAQDMQRVIAYLQKGPATTGEIIRALRLTVIRVNRVLVELREQGLIYRSSYKTSERGDVVNVWACTGKDSEQLTE
ncbi:MarR family transcriptional regulator [Acidithiobacillus thiooxidans]|uniref:Uncharacterized protein n=1 Tax=Acidithiobacillus thiooxidans TaxID=930 RepID=A0A1C2I7J0_ACITH|nr:MarR family transcriptional regulator [Acidithiobacillus thiooxidans]OCX71965.1 hypothetical protein A6M23_10805 [Acidithiobacillus thiooxidans]OCX76738.1 hypothetical protein A6P07_01790 [Acidithiobacillus thiooxidans]OCX81988.1 hypothetical protein A6P08_13075 [Acidithiobacillus thiooxidans]